MKLPVFGFLAVIGFSVVAISCKDQEEEPSADKINTLNLKRGELIVCGSADKQFGSISFATSCSEETKKNFELGIALLHSFEYDEAEKVFAKVIDKDPACAMAFWGVAMSNYHLLWTPPSGTELKKGSISIEIAKRLRGKTDKETGIINAAAELYKDWTKVDHTTRCLNYEKSMEILHREYPADKEIAALYALALNASASPTDTSFRNQRKAGAILAALYPKELDHPGIIHYTIHTYDNPELAAIALPAARRYASVAPSSAHALHMPSHIFTRMGLWSESNQSNLASISSAACYAEQTGIKGHWDEELHGLDYLMYGYLQLGDNFHAMEQWDYLNSIREVNPVNFKVAYAFAAIPARYLLENKMWKDASRLAVSTANFDWQNFQWQKAIIHFARLLGSVHIGRIDSANAELSYLRNIRRSLIDQKDPYKAGQVQIQILASEAWIAFRQGNKAQALKLMQEAADMEDHTQKHPVTPGEVIPARELLGDMFMELNEPAKALVAYEEDLKGHPNRFNGLYGAGLAAEKSNQPEKAQTYYRQLVNITSASNSDRAEINHAKKFLKG